MESIAKLIGENMHKLWVTHLSTAAQAIRLTWVTRWPLLDGDSTGGPLQTLPGKVVAKAWGVDNKI